MNRVSEWFRRRRERRQEEDLQRQAVWRGIHRLYKERGELLHPAVWEMLSRTPWNLRRFGLSHIHAELQRIGWHGEEGRRRIEVEKEGLRLGL